jgi:hypothetical protein
VGKIGRLDFKRRAREKQLARDADAADLAAGRRSAEEIRRSNSLFGAFDDSVLENARIIYPEKRSTAQSGRHRTGRFTVLPPTNRSLAARCGAVGVASTAELCATVPPIQEKFTHG